VGAETPQKVILRFTPAGGQAAFNAEFDGVAWKGGPPTIYVFNQAFVERNVYTSTGVQPEQREALLDLALGDAAVAQRVEFEKQSATQRDCAGKVATAEAALQGYRGSLSVDQFITLKPVHDVDAQVEYVDKQLAEARASEQISKRPEFKRVSVPVFSFEGLPEIAASSFESLSVNAEETAKAHFARHMGNSTERWVSEGMGHGPDEECPFCGQATARLDLLKAYKTYFDNSYSDHLQRIASLRASVDARVTVNHLALWPSSLEFNQGVLSAWSESLGLHDLPTLDVDGALKVLNSVRTDLLKLVDEKEKSPLIAMDASLFERALKELVNIQATAQLYNLGIEKLNQQVAEYKEKLKKPETTGLSSRRTDLLVRKSRFDEAVVALVKDVAEARAAYKSAETAKDSARDALDKLMADTLSKFQGAINAWLGKFSAPFRVKQLAPTYRGGGLRTEYILEVRGVSVNVGPGGPGQLSFHAALSEGDKRTLAFAFFLARLFAEPNRAHATVVLDDVFTSLDRHRRHNTVDAVVKMAVECAQVIALGHDAHFLRELKRAVTKKKVGATMELALQRDGEDYSYLDEFDLDEYCSSEYYKHFILVERFVGGDNTVSLSEVAKALRLLIEGHLHRCFPKRFKEGLTVGEMLDQVQNASAPNPLTRLQHLLPELVTFNDFASAFHHDTSGGYTKTETNAAELLPFAQGALSFIQIRSFK
jgi:wobble nucleotide-excising tRNase